jgi:hypothetical protein
MRKIPLLGIEQAGQLAISLRLAIVMTFVCLAVGLLALRWH